MKTIKIFLYVIAGIFLVLCVSLYLFMQTSATDYNFDISSSDISSDVRIVFDDMAVPHI